MLFVVGTSIPADSPVSIFATWLKMLLTFPLCQRLASLLIVVLVRFSQVVHVQYVDTVCKATVEGTEFLLSTCLTHTGSQQAGSTFGTLIRGLKFGKISN